MLANEGPQTKLEYDTKQLRYNKNQTTLNPNNLTVMVALILVVGILGDPYKISITTRNTLY